MINLWKTYIRKTFRRFGFDVHGFNPNSSPDAQIVASLKKFDIDLVLDVGANAGQFALGIRRGGYAGKIVSFEPLSSAHRKLTKAKGRDAFWDVYRRCAVGDKNGEIDINIAGNSASSSILPMLDSHLMAAPYSAYVGNETVPLFQLDMITPEYF
jgi:FkbM family methyltransferase